MDVLIPSVFTSKHLTAMNSEPEFSLKWFEEVSKDILDQLCYIVLDNQIMEANTEAI